MTEVAFLGILQGVAEFLPISSSGHLVLARNLLGLGDIGLRLDIFLHAGTLLAVGVFYFPVIQRIVRNREWGYLWKIAASSVPVALVGFAFADSLEAAADPTMVACSLIFTGIVLIAVRFTKNLGRQLGISSAILMGMAQALAVLPGVSRSGMTISMARVLGVDPDKAAEFSFLMSAPPIAGAAILEVVKSLSANSGLQVSEISWPECVFGAAISAVVGYFSLKLLINILKRRLFWLFGPYCLAAGLLTLILI